MFMLMSIIFVGGVLAIALEDKIKINKAAIALFMAISLWMILMFDVYEIFVVHDSPIFKDFLTHNPEIASLPLHEQFVQFITNRWIVYHLGNVSETLFFVMCSMLIVDIVDKHIHAFGGSFVITHVGKCALHIIGDILHHLIAVAVTLSVFVRHIEAVKMIEGSLIVRGGERWHGSRRCCRLSMMFCR